MVTPVNEDGLRSQLKMSLKLPSTPAENKRDTTPQTTGAPSHGGCQAWTRFSQKLSWCVLFNTWATIVKFCEYQAHHETTRSLANISPCSLGQNASILSWSLPSVLHPPPSTTTVTGSLPLTASSVGLVGHVVFFLRSGYWEVLLAQSLAASAGSGCFFGSARAFIERDFADRRLDLAVSIASQARRAVSAGFSYTIIAVCEFESSSTGPPASPIEQLSRWHAPTSQASGHARLAVQTLSLYLLPRSQASFLHRMCHGLADRIDAIGCSHSCQVVKGMLSTRD